MNGLTARVAVASLGLTLGCDSSSEVDRAPVRRPMILASAPMAPSAAPPTETVDERTAGEQTAEPSATSVVLDRDQIIRRFHDCTDRCFDADDDRTTDRTTCRLQCAYDVVPDSHESTDEARGCLSTLAGCLGPCHGNALETDAATCRLRCEAVAEDCLEEAGA